MPSPLGSQSPFQLTYTLSSMKQEHLAYLSVILQLKHTRSWSKILPRFLCVVFCFSRKEVPHIPKQEVSTSCFASLCAARHNKYSSSHSITHLFHRYLRSDYQMSETVWNTRITSSCPHPQATGFNGETSWYLCTYHPE